MKPTLIRRLAGVIAALAVAAPGPGTSRAFASVRAAPLPASGVVTGPLALRFRAEAGFSVRFHAAFRLELGELARCPTLEERGRRLAEGLRRPRGSPEREAARFLWLAARRPREALPLWRGLRAAMPEGSYEGDEDVARSLGDYASAWAAEPDSAWLADARQLSEWRRELLRHELGPGLEAGLELESRVPSSRPNVFLARSPSGPAFVKVGVHEEEVRAQALAAEVPLPAGLSVPALRGVGEPGLPELARLGPPGAVPSGYAEPYAAQGRRVLATDPVPAGALRLDRVLAGRAAAAPLSEADWAGFEEGLARLHEAGVSHGDLKPDNVFLSQEDGRATFHLVDWGRGRFPSDPGFAVDVRGDLEALGSLRKALERRGLLAGLRDAVGKTGLNATDLGEEEEPEAPEPRSWRKLAAVLALAAALAFLPALAFGEPLRAWALPTLFTEGPLSVSPWTLLWVPAGALLGAADKALGFLAHRLHPVSLSSGSGGASRTVGAIERMKRLHPADPRLVGPLALRAFLEELAYRLLLFTMAAQLLAGALPAWLLYPAAATAVSAVFAVRHGYGSFWSRVTAGLLYQGLFLASGSLWLPVATHFFSNWWWFWLRHGDDPPEEDAGTNLHPAPGLKAGSDGPGWRPAGRMRVEPWAHQPIQEGTRPAHRDPALPASSLRNLRPGEARFSALPGGTGLALPLREAVVEALAAHGGRAAWADDSAIHVAEAGSGEPLARINIMAGARVTGLALSPSGARLGVLVRTSGGRFDAISVDLKSGESRSWRLPGGGAGLSFSPDGETLALLLESRELALWKGDDILLHPRTRAQASLAPVFSGDGSRLALSTHGGDVELWTLRPAGQPRLILQTDNTGAPQAAALDGTGERVAAADAGGRLWLWDLRQGSRAILEWPQRAAGSRPKVLALAWDGGDLLAAVPDGLYRVKDPGGEASLERLPQDAVEQASFAPTAGRAMVVAGGARRELRLLRLQAAAASRERPEAVRKDLAERLALPDAVLVRRLASMAADPLEIFRLAGRKWLLRLAQAGDPEARAALGVLPPDSSKPRQ